MPRSKAPTPAASTSRIFGTGKSGDRGASRSLQSVIPARDQQHIRTAVLGESPEVRAASGDVSHDPEMFRMLERLCERGANPAFADDGEVQRLRWCHDSIVLSHKTVGRQLSAPPLKKLGQRWRVRVS